MKAWLAKVWIWLATHPWPIVATLGGALVLVLFRRRKTTRTVDIAIAQDTARADAKHEEAAKLEPRVETGRKTIEATEQKLRAVEALPKEDITHASDVAIADSFTRSGL